MGLALSVQPDEPVRQPMSPIVADAMTRIPSANFKNKAWARFATETCTKMITEAIERGDQGRFEDWMRDVTHAPNTDDLVCRLLLEKKKKTGPTASRTKIHLKDANA